MGIGGKGTQRRNHKHKAAKPVVEDKMFRDDNTVVHIKKPTVQYSFKEQLLVLQGNSETKNLKDMLPEILKQVGPQQFNYLKDMIAESMKVPDASALYDKAKAAEEDDDVPPPLV